MYKIECCIHCNVEIDTQEKCYDMYNRGELAIWHGGGGADPLHLGCIKAFETALDEYYEYAMQGEPEQDD